MNSDCLGHIDIAINDEGQVGPVNSATALECVPFFLTNNEALLFPLSSGVGEEVASAVSSVDASELPVSKLDFITSGLCHSKFLSF